MNDKPKLVRVTDATEIAELLKRRGELDVPLLMPGAWALADELRAWRASQSTSEGKL
jgi:hypothetical protein